MSTALGIDIGGTRIKAAIVDECGSIVRRETRPTEDDGNLTLKFAHHIRELVDEMGRDLPVGISAPGLARRDGRAIGWMPGKLPGIENLDWTEWLARERPVPVANDAHAALGGEAWIGAARGFQNAILLTLGTGIGGAILSEGRLLRGQLGRAGHLGHVCLDLDSAERSICGMPGALECLLGNYNIHARTGGRYETTLALVEAYRDGNADAARLWLASLRALACAIASFVNMLDPEAVILGGGIALAGDPLFEPLQRKLDAIEWRPGGHAVKLLPAQLGDWAGAIGAARAAMLAA